ncbi:hypothetical protein [Thermoplasma volcanium GSS1]|uniref:Carbon monoxide dehydrogenase subunit G n=1 Tax=Thermoplasma volcanium (strain ATCC 51530 / DSM 4299 / JCM 9571 / NBRC 15438 / GSS1) TaxID=273116 RepID=Q97AF7_THEVO|nr:CoxG family protein [Thermoplasma volcanium]BAB59995.1 hypothetical protein [Thermoplasma volcanium GSS1]
MDYSGSFYVDRDPAEVKQFISNFENVVACLPGIDSYTNNGNEFECRIRLDISSLSNSYLKHISGKMKFLFVPERDNGISVNGSGRIAGSSVSMNVKVFVEGSNEHAKVTWSAAIDYGLILKAMGSEKIKEVTDENIKRSIECLRGKISMH